MHAALYAAGIRKNDEVIVTPLTMSSTSFVIRYLEAIPIYADVDLNTYQILPEEIEKINKKTKAIITVALYGGSPKLDKIKTIAKNNIFLLEDNAETMFQNTKINTLEIMVMHQVLVFKAVSILQQVKVE